MGPGIVSARAKREYVQAIYERYRWARRRLRLRAGVAQQLVTISPRQMDRRLAPYRRELLKRLYGRTKPGTLLKHHIPLKTDRWDVATPGFTEIDLVAHCGSLGDGE